MIAEYIGNQWDKGTVLHVEHDAPRRVPMPVGKTLAAVREILHATPRAGSGPEVYRIEGPEAGSPEGRRNLLPNISVLVV